MNSRGPFKIWLLNQLDPCLLDDPISPFYQLFYQHTSRRDDIRNASFPRGSRSSPSRPEKNGVQMHDRESNEIGPECPSERRRPEKPAQHVRGKIPDLNTIKRNGRPKRHRSVVRTIHISCEHFDMVPPRHQCTTESMNRKAWTAIARSWQIRGNHM